MPLRHKDTKVRLELICECAQCPFVAFVRWCCYMQVTFSERKTRAYHFGYIFTVYFTFSDPGVPDV